MFLAYSCLENFREKSEKDQFCYPFSSRSIMTLDRNKLLMLIFRQFTHISVLNCSIYSPEHLNFKKAYFCYPFFELVLQDARQEQATRAKFSPISLYWHIKRGQKQFRAKKAEKEFLQNFHIHT